jgi:hypothetical protein
VSAFSSILVASILLASCLAGCSRSCSNSRRSSASSCPPARRRLTRSNSRWCKVAGRCKLSCFRCRLSPVNDRSAARRIGADRVMPCICRDGNARHDGDARDARVPEAGLLRVRCPPSLVLGVTVMLSLRSIRIGRPCFVHSIHTRRGSSWRRIAVWIRRATARATNLEEPYAHSLCLAIRLTSSPSAYRCLTLVSCADLSHGRRVRRGWLREPAAAAARPERRQGRQGQDGRLCHVHQLGAGWSTSLPLFSFNLPSFLGCGLSLRFSRSR